MRKLTLDIKNVNKKQVIKCLQKTMYLWHYHSETVKQDNSGNDTIFGNKIICILINNANL